MPLKLFYVTARNDVYNATSIEFTNQYGATSHVHLNQPYMSISPKE